MKLLFVSVLTLLFIYSSVPDKNNITRMNTPSVNTRITGTKTINAKLNDTIPNKCIKIYTDTNGYPVKYSRNIITGVCIAGECRKMAITIYWNTTGQYLGFELSQGEFLSKTEHNPFSTFEYDQLHNLLAEENSPLASYSIEELVPKTDTAWTKTDAITSATINAVLDYIVEGAVYTTYTLWHIVYGPTQNEIEKLSTNKLDAGLCLILLNTNNIKDQIWTLNHISEELEISPELQSKLMELISGTNIYLSERALHAIKPDIINDEIQIKLASLFPNSGFLQKRLIIQKFNACKSLSPYAVKILSTDLQNLNGTLTNNLLEMYSAHNVDDEYTISEVLKLLKHENVYIAKQAVDYLDEVDNLDTKTVKALNKYKKRNS